MLSYAILGCNISYYEHCHYIWAHLEPNLRQKQVCVIAIANLAVLLIHHGGSQQIGLFVSSIMVSCNNHGYNLNCLSSRKSIAIIDLFSAGMFFFTMLGPCRLTKQCHPLVCVWKEPNSQLANYQVSVKLWD